MALTVLFKGMQPASDVTLGPFQAIRIAGNFMRAGDDNHVIASYARHQWGTGKQYFASYQCRGQAVVYFEDAGGSASEHFGPFDAIHFSDGTMYAGDVVFAKFIDESVLWHSMRLETWWPTLVMEAAAP